MKSPIDVVLNAPVFSPIRVAALSAVTKVLARRNISLVSANTEPYREDAYNLIRRTRQETSMVLLDPEAYSIYAAAVRTAKVPGDIAEVGVYKGGSARLICEVKGNRRLHLFDTFEGLPECTEWDPDFRAGGFAASFDQVSRYLARFPNVQFHRGFFPATAQGMESLRFSFVHLDVDLYQSTKDGLEWFYPRLNRGGILISHDYVNAEGVRKAFDEFFEDKPECLLELSGTQVAFSKL
jgi:predicted O-methyltransferase YrrM